jgi:acyl dehydratase
MAIPNEMKALIGVPTEPSVWEVEKGSIRRYAGAIADPNPLYCDEDHAKRTKYGGVICPHGFFGWQLSGERPGFAVAEKWRKVGAPRLLDGGIDYEFFKPIHAGDVLVSSSKIADIAERETKRGPMYFTTMETTYQNQNGEVVCKARSTLITY